MNNNHSQSVFTVIDMAGNPYEVTTNRNHSIEEILDLAKDEHGRIFKDIIKEVHVQGAGKPVGRPTLAAASDLNAFIETKEENANVLPG